MSSGEPDDEVTAPVLTGRRLHAEYEELELAVGERGEIVVAPESLMCRPILSLQTRGSEVLVEDLYSGKSAIARHGQWPAECLRDGVQLEVSVSRELPLKIVLFNAGPEPTVVGASLVTGSKER